MFGQVMTVPAHSDDIGKTLFEVFSVEQDTVIISKEELYLKEISDKALAKEEKREKITNRVLAVLVVILLVDKFVN